MARRLLNGRNEALLFPARKREPPCIKLPHVTHPNDAKLERLQFEPGGLVLVNHFVGISIYRASGAGGNVDVSLVLRVALLCLVPPLVSL